MNNKIVKSPWVIGNISLQPGKAVQISIVAYEHSAGMPARFCAGLVPAVDLSRQLKRASFESIVRVIDPTPIANHCNGWQTKKSQFRDIITDFFNTNATPFFFDEAEQVSVGALDVLKSLGNELELSTDEKVKDMVKRIRESGRRHGGDSGAGNSTLYMAAHPFSWLDMYHPLIWKRSYSLSDYHFVNLMSIPEERFALIRKFLQLRRQDLCTKNNSIDRLMTICHTPCYIPLDGEPKLEDLITHGYDWCFAHYCEIKTRSIGHSRVQKDFEALMSFLGKDSA